MVVVVEVVEVVWDVTVLLIVVVVEVVNDTTLPMVVLVVRVGWGNCEEKTFPLAVSTLTSIVVPGA